MRPYGCRYYRADGRKCEGWANASGLCPRHAGANKGQNNGGRRRERSSASLERFEAPRGATGRSE